jgi:para-aminobenzoate synthetase/4-amino-4-deoxychorismate lyase
MLIETGAIFLRRRHRERLLKAASFFDFSCAGAAIEATLTAAERELAHGRYKLRLLVSQDGRIDTNYTPMIPQSPRRLYTTLASGPVNSRDPFLRHKTTWRPTYDSALAQQPSLDDVILWNENGWVTESCRANVVARVGGELLTPSVDCGLLPGTFRAELLQAGVISEARIDREMLQHAEALYLINSVRRWMPIQLLTGTETSRQRESSAAL